MIAFSLDGGNIGCLLVHGFGGHPNEMLPLGTFLNSQGYSVIGVQLPGHGSDELNAATITWEDWLTSVLEGFEVLSGKADTVFVLGHSLGAILALITSVTHPSSGIIAYAPISHLPIWQRLAIKVSHKIFKTVPLPSYDTQSDSNYTSKLIHTNLLYQLTKFLENGPPLLKNVNIPVLILSGGKDKVIPKDSSLRVSQMASYTNRIVVTFSDADHMIMLTGDREKVWEVTLDFILANEPMLS